MNDKDLRVIRTKKAIKNSFREMIVDMDAHKITVKELTDRAQIHRKTFYLHYSCIEDVFEEMLREILDEYNQEMDQLEPPLYIKDTNRIFFTFFSKQAPYVEKLLCHESYQSVCRKLLFSSLNHNHTKMNPFEKYQEDYQKIIDEYMINATLMLYRQWVSHGKKVPIEQMIELSSQLLENGVSSLRK